MYYKNTFYEKFKLKLNFIAMSSDADDRTCYRILKWDPWANGGWNNSIDLTLLSAWFISLLNTLHTFQCIRKIFFAEFQLVPLKFHIKYLSHILKDAIFIQCWKFCVHIFKRITHMCFETPNHCVSHLHASLHCYITIPCDTSQAMYMNIQIIQHIYNILSITENNQPIKSHLRLLWLNKDKRIGIRLWMIIQMDDISQAYFVSKFDWAV